MKGIYLKGNRVSLYPLKIRDAGTLTEIFNKSKDFLGRVGADDITIKMEEDFIRTKNKEEGHYIFAIRLNSDSRIIGTMSIFDISIHDGTGETGAMIGLNYADKGYGTEAKHILLNWIFNSLKLRRVYSKTYSYNERSLAYSLKCGYVDETVIKEIKFYKDKYWDMHHLYITKDLWLPVYEKYNKKHLS